MDGCSLLGLIPGLVVVLVGAFRSSAVDPFTTPHSLGSRLASRVVRSYQLNLSARRAEAVCQLTPSCSRYGLQTLAEHGALRSAVLIRARIRECGRVGRARRGLVTS